MQMLPAILQFQATNSAAKSAERQGKIEAQHEEIAATQREADRKERLAEAMASQTASAGARGIAAFEGSPLTVLQEDVRKEEQATSTDRFNAQMAGLTSRIRGNTTGASLRSQARIGLLSDTINAAQSAGLPGK